MVDHPSPPTPLGLAAAAEVPNPSLRRPQASRPRTEAPRAQTPVAFVRSIVGALERAGRDPAPCLAAAQIPPALLSQPLGWITARQLEQVSDCAMRTLDDEALGWFHRPLPWGSYGMLARASLTAPTLRVALLRWCRHHGLIAPDVRLHLAPCEDDPTQAELRLEEVAPAPWLVGEVRGFCHVSLLRNALGLSSWLIDSHITLARADWAFPPPPHADSHALLFPAAQGNHFDQAHTRVRFSAAYLGLPVVRDEAAMRRMLAHALPLLVKGHRPDRLLASRILRLFAEQPHTLRNAQSLADALGLSVRTLHRQLASQGTPLQSLKDQFRRQRALELRDRHHWPLKKIAPAVGFANDKGLMRFLRERAG